MYIMMPPGFFICLECSGIHRKLGVHVSKVKSATLDRWSWQWIESVRNIGNDVAAAYYECRLPKDYKKPQHGDDGTVLENWIRMKYERKCFAPKDKKEPWQVLAEGGDPRIYLLDSTETPPEGKKVKEKKEKKKKKETARDAHDNTPTSPGHNKREDKSKDAESKSVAAAAASLSALVDDFASLGFGDLNASTTPQAVAATTAVRGGGGGGAACLSATACSSSSRVAAAVSPLTEADKKVAVAKAAIAALFNNSNFQSSAGGVHAAYVQRAAGCCGSEGDGMPAMNGSKSDCLFATGDRGANIFSSDPSHFSSSLYPSSAAGPAGTAAASAAPLDAAFSSAPQQQLATKAAAGTLSDFWPAAAPAASEMLTSGTAAAPPHASVAAAAAPAWIATWPPVNAAAVTDALPLQQQQQQSTFSSLFSNPSSSATSGSAAAPGQVSSWAALSAPPAAAPSNSAQPQQPGGSISSSGSTGLSMPTCGITPWDIAASNSNSAESTSSSALNSLDAFALAGKVQPQRQQQQRGETKKQQQNAESNADSGDVWQSAAPPASPPKPKGPTEELLLI